MLRVGEIVGITKLHNMYDRHVFRVLSGHFEQLPRERGQRRRYKVVKDTPDDEQYNTMRNNHYRTTVESLIDEAYGEVESLTEEMREWYDNIPENLQEGDLAQRVNDAADALENLDRQDYPEGLPQIDTIFLPSLDISSRSDRACEAGSQLRFASDTIREWLEEEDQATLPEDERTEASQLADEISNHADELEAVDFPSMFG